MFQDKRRRRTGSFAPSGYVSGIFFMKDVFGKSIFDLVIVFVYLFQTSS